MSIEKILLKDNEELHSGKNVLVFEDGQWKFPEIKKVFIPNPPVNHSGIITRIFTKLFRNMANKLSSVIDKILD